jgi:hypothetical protein
MQQGEEQDAAYAGRGLRPEEYSVLVIVAKYQENLVKGTRKKAA